MAWAASLSTRRAACHDAQMIPDEACSKQRVRNFGQQRVPGMCPTDKEHEGHKRPKPMSKQMSQLPGCCELSFTVSGALVPQRSTRWTSLCQRGMGLSICRYRGRFPFWVPFKTAPTISGSCQATTNVVPWRPHVNYLKG